jgi:hypothetical protein
MFWGQNIGFCMFGMCQGQNIGYIMFGMCHCQTEPIITIAFFQEANKLDQILILAQTITLREKDKKRKCDTGKKALKRSTNLYGAIETSREIKSRTAHWSRFRLFIRQH